MSTHPKYYTAEETKEMLNDKELMKELKVALSVGTQDNVSLYQLPMTWSSSAKERSRQERARLKNQREIARSVSKKHYTKILHLIRVANVDVFYPYPYNPSHQHVKDAATRE